MRNLISFCNRFFFFTKTAKYSRQGDVEKFSETFDTLPPNLIDYPFTMENKSTCLHLGIRYGHTAIVQFLFDRGANLYLRDRVRDY